jgi:hypothetical protein
MTNVIFPGRKSYINTEEFFIFPLLQNRGIFREVVCTQVVHRVIFITFFC